MQFQRSWRAGAVAVLASGALLLTACSGSTEEKQQGGSDNSAVVAEAQAGAEEMLRAGIEENAWAGPESSPAPVAGQKLVIIPEQMATSGSSRAALQAETAAKALGWDVKISDGQGQADVQLKALNSAIDEGADAVILMFVDTTRVQSGVQRALDAGVKLLTLGSMKNTPETIPDVSIDFYRTGEGVGQYIVWKSDGEANVLQMQNSDLYVVKNGQFLGSQDYITENCPDCNTTVKEWSLANFNNPTTGPGAQGLAALQADPNLDWVACFDDCLFKVMQGMDRAGLSEKVSGAGFDCNPENIAIIAQGGSQKVCAADSREWTALAAVDNINRMLAGEEPFDYTEALPIALFDQESLSQLDDEQLEELEKKGWQGNYDFRAKFSELWGVTF